MKKLIDLSHSIEDGMVTYKGLPAPLVCDYLSREQAVEHYAEGTSFQIGRIDMVANTGTYIDAPFHRYAEGQDLAELSLAAVAQLDGVVVGNGREQGALGPELFADVDVCGRAVLVHTGWAQNWGQDLYFEGHPHLNAAAATYLKDAGAALVGIDSLNIDSTETGERPVHSTLLGANILIVEHLRGLEQLPPTGFEFSAVPVKVRGMGTFPVRAYASLRL